MTREQAEAALKEAGADSVEFMDSFGFLNGIMAAVGDKKNAVRWPLDVELMPSAVCVLKDWVARNARPR